ncbi:MULTISPECIES: LuxR family transcriptional regulator [unclassified Streptomyces]|uniref:LuxR family transcriptional regulator n=1 Tax=unclassified Streptomyces TaxID=2593676 RepID=UPI0037932A39
MTNAKVSAALRRLGVGPDATRIYLALLESAPTPLNAVATEAGLGEGEMADSYAELVDAGLVSFAADEQDVVAPVPPTAGLQALGRHRVAEIDESRIAVARAFDSFRRQRLAPYSDDLVEVVTGDDIGPRVRQAWVSAQEQIRQFDTPPYFPLTGGLDDALTTLERGITQRVLYSRDSLEYPGNLVEIIEPCINAGEHARVLPSLPVKLIIIDDAYALVSLSIREAEVHDTMLIVQPSGLFSALVALFEQSWQNALPFQGPAPRPHRLLPAERRLLSLLAGGVADDDIAEQLGISRRTLFRRVEVLMTRLGATTRFQMALQAQRRGWL